ncbi:beta strand repeat-containing protein, partial [Paralcaligenes ureilyticus]
QANKFTGDVSLTNSGANAVTLSNGANALSLGTSSVGSGTLAVSGTGITQTGAITQAAGAGAASFTAGAGAITLTNAGNTFTGAVSLSNSGANDVALSNGANALLLGTSSVGRGALTVSGTGITQTGAITQTAGTGAASFNAGTGALTLTDTDNDFRGAVSLTGGTTQITDKSALTLGMLTTGALTATSAGALNLGGGTVGGVLTATSTNNAITQAGALTVTGTSGINAGAGAITLTNAGNTFTGAVSLTNSMGNDVALSNGANALLLGASSVGSGTLTVSGTGITQTGAITQAAGAGAANFDAGAGAITLTNTGNAFTGAVGLTNSGGNDIALSNNTNALSLGTSSVGSGTLTVSGTGITQTGGITQAVGAGTASFNAGAGVLTLTKAGNDFTGAVDLTGTTTQITDANALTLGTLATGALTATSTGALNLGHGTVTGNLIATSNGGSLSESGALNVAGTSSFNTGGGAVVLNNVGNQFTGAVGLNGSSGNFTLVNNADLTIAATDVNAGGIVNISTLAGHSLTLPSGSKITASGTGDALTLAAGAAFVNNNAASNALSVSGGGRWLVWSQNPSADTRGGLAYSFKQYNAVNGTTPVAQSTGNGFLYTLAPTLTTTLTGVVGKIYDGTTAATLTASNYAAPSGMVDGDTAVVASPGTATFDTKNVGVGKTVTSLGPTYTFADGSAAVYGYQASAPVPGAVGTITAKAITVDAAGANKVYDGTTIDAVTLASAGVVSGDAITFSGDGRFADKNAGAAKAVSVSGISASGVDAGNYSLTNATAATTADITPATLIYQAAAAQSVVGKTPLGLSGTVSGLVGGDTLAAATTGTLAWTSPATANSLAGVYAINGSGLAASNYLFAQAPGNATALTVQPAASVGPVVPASAVNTVAALQQSAGPSYQTMWFERGGLGLPLSTPLQIINGGVQLPASHCIPGPGRSCH